MKNKVDQASLSAPLISSSGNDSQTDLSPPFSRSLVGGFSQPGPLLPFQGFGLHLLSLTKLVSAGLDMKNRRDHLFLVTPVFQECGGSIQGIASNIRANLNIGLSDSESFAARKAAFGENRLPEKPMVRGGPCHSHPYVFFVRPHHAVICRSHFGSSVSMPSKTRR
jgi:hypothetical protein